MKKRRIKKLWAANFKPCGIRTEYDWRNSDLSRDVAIPKNLVDWFLKKIDEAMASR